MNKKNKLVLLSGLILLAITLLTISASAYPYSIGFQSPYAGSGRSYYPNYQIRSGTGYVFSPGYYSGPLYYYAPYRTYGSQSFGVFGSYSSRNRVYPYQSLQYWS